MTFKLILISMHIRKEKRKKRKKYVISIAIYTDYNIFTHRYNSFCYDSSSFYIIMMKVLVNTIF